MEKVESDVTAKDGNPCRETQELLVAQVESR
jgi:hypothetical protein